jgi:hypothetical protein
MNTWREIGPMAKEPVRFTCPDGRMMGLNDTGLSLEWECAERVFRIYLYGLSYATRHVYRGRALPRDGRQWREERYEIPLPREIRIVLGATKGLTDRELAQRLARPQFEVTAIMEFHGYCAWNPLNKVIDPGKKRGRWVDPKWPAHLAGAIAAAEEVIDVFRGAFPRASLAQEAAMLREWEQLARVSPHFLSPGFGSILQEADNLKVAGTKKEILDRIAWFAAGKIASPWANARFSRGRRR